MKAYTYKRYMRDGTVKEFNAVTRSKTEGKRKRAENKAKQASPAPPSDN